MKIGELLKEHRLRLGITQKEMAHEVLTPSYYSKVERGEHKISAEDLLMILKKHSIDPGEFMGAINQNSMSSTTSFEKINSEITLYYYQQNIKELEKMTVKIEANSDLTSFYRQLLLSLNEIVLFTISENEKYLSDVNTEFLKEQFFEAENWNTFKLSLYTNIMEIYDLQSNHAIITSLLHKKIEDYEEDEQLIILYILINFSNQCLLEESLLLAKHYNQLVLERSSNYNNVLQKIIARYHEYIFLFLDDPCIEKENEALDFIKIFEQIDFGLYEPAVDLVEKVKEIYLD